MSGHRVAHRLGVPKNRVSCLTRGQKAWFAGREGLAPLRFLP